MVINYVLIVDGKRYDHVRGFKPFYLRVPGMNSIFFVVDKADYTTYPITYHFVDMDKREDIAVPAKHSGFGNTIGYKDCEDSVQIGKDGMLILTTDSPAASVARTKLVYYLDLDQKKVVSDKIYYYDASGKLTHERDE